MDLRTGTRLCGVAAMVVTGVMAAGCQQPAGDITGPSPALTATFASINSEIFQKGDRGGRMACSSCHQGTIPNISLNFTAGDVYGQLVNTPSRQRRWIMLITPGDPDNSYLLHKLEGRSGIEGERMPASGPPHLSDSQIRVIRRWIEIGAPR